MPKGHYKRTKPAWNRGKPMSAEQKQKISISAKGHIVSEETRAKISSSLKGHMVSEETKDRVRESQIGRIADQASHWKNGRYTGDKGYVFVYTPDHPFAIARSYVLEHRLVLEKRLGRYLLPGEIGHHKDGIKDNNEDENLYLCKTNSEHRKIHQNMYEIVYILYQMGIVGFEEGQYVIK